MRSQLDAGRWQRVGRAVVVHNGPLTKRDQWDCALINVGPRAMLTAFTAAEHLGLKHWSRREIHVLAPINSQAPRNTGLPIRLHRTRAWAGRSDALRLQCQALAPALVIAAGTFESSRPACGILAAAVQQRLVTAEALRLSVCRSTRVRHRRVLLAALADIAGGADALSEIDFVALCRRHGIPAPEQQSVRRDSNGRRRYVDAAWRRRDGRLVVVEVDGAVHLNVMSWGSDQLRQNEIALGDALVLRFPTVVVRTQEALVVRQLRRALMLE